MAGRIVAVALIPISKAFVDITDATEWNQDVIDGNIILFKETRGSYPRASAVTAPSRGTQDTKTVGASHTMNFFTNYVKGNHGFWNALRYSSSFKIAFVVGNYDSLYYVNVACSIDGQPPVDESINSETEWDVQVTWSDANTPEISDVPPGVFTT